jgi:hypothetical protein
MAHGQDLPPELMPTAAPFVSTGAEHVPADAIIVSRMNVPHFFKTPGLDWLPLEVAQAWSESKLGLNPMDILEIKSVMGMPTGPGQQSTGILITLAEDYDPSKISAELLGNPPTETIAGRTVHIVAGAKPVLSQPLSWNRCDRCWLPCLKMPAKRFHLSSPICSSCPNW